MIRYIPLYSHSYPMKNPYISLTVNSPESKKVPAEGTLRRAIPGDQGYEKNIAWKHWMNFTPFFIATYTHIYIYIYTTRLFSIQCKCTTYSILVHNCTDTIPTFRRSSSSTTGGKQPFSPHSKNLQTLMFYPNVDSLGFDHVM